MLFRSETSWEDVVEHGYVAIKDAEGRQLARRDGFQHNRYLRSGGAKDMAAIKELATEVKKAVAAAQAA